MSAAIPARTLSPAARADETLRLAPGRLLGAVRWRHCPVCGTGPYTPCQLIPAADHLGRWLAAYAAGKLTRADMAEVIGGLVVITAASLIEERTA